MKRKIYLLAPVLVIVAFLVSAFTGFNNTDPTNMGGVKNIYHSNGAPAGYTGSPGDGHNCTSCHGGNATTQAGIITSNVPSQGYTAGSSYTITVSFTGSGNKGFEVSPQSVSGTLLGTLTAGTGNKLVGTGKYCTHSTPIGGSSATWTFTWVAPAAGTGTVTFYGAFAITEATTKVSTLVVNENTASPLSVTATATPSTILSGNTSQLHATGAGGSGTYTYSWTSLPAGFTSTQQNPTVSPTVTTQYTVTINDGSGTASGSTTVTVIPNNLAVVANANPSTITSGQSSQLSSSATGGSGTYTYSWTSLPAGFTSNQQNPSVSPTVTTQYTVQANDGYQTTTASTTVTLTGGVFSINATATPGSICSGQTSQLYVSPTGGSGTYTYSWTSLPPGFTSTLQNPVVSPTATTQYISSVNDGTQTLTDTTQVSVTAPPTAAAGNDTTVCDIVTDIPVNGTATGYSTVAWTTNGDGTFSNSNNLSGTYFPGSADKTNGSVILTLTASPLAPCSNPVSATRTISFDPCGVGIQGLTVAPFTFSISPNPSSGSITISGNTLSDEGVRITILDLNGKVVRNENPPVPGNTLEVKIDLSALAKGVYFVRIETKSGTKVKKLILQ